MEEEGGEEAITFLYKFTEGACPKSYGFNVAQLASLPSSVITLARRKATTCEQEAQHVRLLRCVDIFVFIAVDIEYIHFCQENSTAKYEKSGPKDTTINTELHLVLKRPCELGTNHSVPSSIPPPHPTPILMRHSKIGLFVVVFFNFKLQWGMKKKKQSRASPWITYNGNLG